MSQSFSLTINHNVVGHGSLEQINEAVSALQKLTPASDCYLAGDYGRVVHETDVGNYQLKIESCDVLTYPQFQDAQVAAKLREEEKKSGATGGAESDSLEPARS
jgi:hypothetical protein